MRTERKATMKALLHHMRIPLIVIALLVFTVTAGVTPASACSSNTWHIVNSPNASTTATNSLLAVVAISTNNVWAVGYPTERGVLIEHWNGHGWQVVPGPKQGTTSDTLKGIAAVSARDIWAVGDRYDAAKNVYKTLVEHWNGSAWSIVPSPNVGPNSSSLSGVTVLSRNNVWAVGSSYDNVKTSASRTLFLHWNGSSWRVVASPNASGGKDRSSLRAITAIAANDIWAVGNYYDIASNTALTLIEHWNGQRWAVVASPNPPAPSDSQLNGVAASSSRDVWAVGTRLDLPHNSYQTLTLHWNGARWKIAGSPNATPADSYLNAVTVRSARDAWAVGIYGTVRTDTALTLIEHWNGESWSIVSSPNVGMGNDLLWAITRVPGTNKAWAVGSHSGPVYQTLILYKG
jgi:hypothetical protein